MDSYAANDAIARRVRAMCQRVEEIKASKFYFYNQPVDELRGGAWVRVGNREMGMYASYSYLGLLGHPRINEAARRAIEQYGTGTHGVRFLAGTLPIHRELEETIAAFKNADAAVTFSSGYVTNLSVISTLWWAGETM